MRHLAPFALLLVACSTSVERSTGSTGSTSSDASSTAAGIEPACQIDQEECGPATGIGPNPHEGAPCARGGVADAGVCSGGWCCAPSDAGAGGAGGAAGGICAGVQQPACVPADGCQVGAACQWCQPGDGVCDASGACCLPP